jgi:hypothetical protein
MVSLRGSFKLEVSSVKLEKVWCRALWPPISHFPEKTPYGVTTTGAKMRKTNPISPRRGGKRAERTQLGPPEGPGRRKMCETKPNLEGLGYVGKGRRRVGHGPGGE